MIIIGNIKKGKLHLLDPANITSFWKVHRDILKDYSSFIRDMVKSNYEIAVNFISWLGQYLKMIKNESNFDSTYLPSYQRGQILLLNLGFRIGYELRGPHYGIVLDTDNRKKDGLVTVALMVSKKKKHFENGLKPWEYEIPFPISVLVVEKACKLLSEMSFDAIMNECLDKSRPADDDSLPDAEHDILQNVLKKLGQKMEQEMKPLMDFSKKMTKGSIVDTRQIITLSKQRIIAPIKRTEHLYGICFPSSIMQDISNMLIKNFISKEVLDDTPKKE